MDIGSITWQYPWWLLIVPGMIAVSLLLRKVNVFDTTKARAQTTKNTLTIAPLLIFRLAFWTSVVLIGLLLAGPTVSHQKTSITYEGIDIMLVIDVSESMQAQDFEPSRILGAKRVVSDFLDRAQGHRIGVVLFSGQPFILSPLTHDTDFLQEMIGDLSTQSIQDEYLAFGGTAIGDAILLATGHLEDNKKDRDQVIILVTDGESNQGADPDIAAVYARNQGISIETIGMGDPEGSWQTIEVGTFIQQTFLKLDEQTLKDISQTTSGSYVRALDTDHMSTIFESISDAHPSKIEEEIIRWNTPHVRPFLLALLVTLIIQALLIFFIPRLRPI